MAKYGFSRLNVASAFQGVNQAKDGRYLAAGESPAAYNFRANKGILSTAPGYSKHIATALPAAPVALMLFFKYTDKGTVTKHLLVSTANNLYVWSGSAWTSIKGSETITSGDFSFANYRENGVSKIILSNGVDPVFQWTGTGSISKLYYDATDPSNVLEAPRGKCVTIHVERLWAAGVTGSPQTVFASDAYAPSNWVVGEDDAGYITVSTWDGGSVVGLAAMLGDVVVFKQNSIFRVVGTYPAEFEPVQVFTMEGTIAPRTLCQYNNRAYFLSEDGIMVYDTSKAVELIPYVLKDFWAQVNIAKLDVACGIAHNNILYMAVPYGTNQQTNNAVIEYDIVNRTVFLRTGISVARFLEDNEDLLFVGPGNYVYKYGSGTTLDGTAVAATWDTPLTDFGVQGRKFTYDLYITGWTDTVGGQVKVDAIVDDTVAATSTVTLPTKQDVVRTTLRASGRVMKFRISNVSGSVVHIARVDVDFDVMED